MSRIKSWNLDEKYYYRVSNRAERFFHEIGGEEESFEGDKAEDPPKGGEVSEKQMTVVEQANTFTPRYTFASGWRVWRVADPMPQTFKELEEDTGEGG